MEANNLYNPLKISTKGILLFLFAFFLLYFENFVNLGPVKLTELWKTPILIYLLYYALYPRKNKALPKYLILSLLFFIKSFFYINYSDDFSLYNPSITFKFLVFPLITYAFSNFYRNKLETLKDILIKISIFFLISTIPFHLHLIQQLSNSGDMTRFGYEGKTYFTGVFENAGNASKVFVLSICILMSYYIYFKQNSQKLFFYWFLILLTLYSLYSSFMRTGWFTFFIGVSLILFYQKKALSFLARVPLFIVILLLVYDFYQSNEVVQMRVNDLSVSKINKGISSVDVEQRGSGRLLMAGSAIENITNLGIATVLVGYDAETAFDEMERNIGIRVGAHNFLLDTLSLNGLIGLILWFLIMYNIYKIIFSNYSFWRGDLDVRMGQIIFILYLMFNFFSGGASIWGDLIMGITTSIVVIKKSNLKNLNYE